MTAEPPPAGSRSRSPEADPCGADRRWARPRKPPIARGRQPTRTRGRWSKDALGALLPQGSRGKPRNLARSWPMGTKDQAKMRDEEAVASMDPLSEGTTLELAREAERGPWSVEIGSPTSGGVLSLESGSALVLGSGRRADAFIEDRTVSAVHARLSAADAGLLVEDLAS